MPSRDRSGADGPDAAPPSCCLGTKVSCKDNCYFSYLFQNKFLARTIVTLIPARHEVKEARRGRLVPAHTERPDAGRVVRSEQMPLSCSRWSVLLLGVAAAGCRPAS